MSTAFRSCADSRFARSATVLTTGRVAALAAALALLPCAALAQPTDFRIAPIPSQTDGVGFTITVEAVDGGGTPTPVVADTFFMITLDNGNGTLLGNDTGSIPMGGTGTAVTGILYFTDGTENNVRLTVTQTAGDPLNADTSNSFNIELADLIANEVAVDVTASQTNVTVTYTVSSLSTVANFNIRLGLDTDNDGDIDTQLGAAFAATDRSPGTYMAPPQDVRAALDGLATPVKHGDNIVVEIDSDDDILESDELTSSNRLSSSDLVVDIAAGACTVTVNSATTDVVVTYTIIAPADVANFAIQLGIDTDNDGTINTNLGAAFDPIMFSPGTNMTSAQNIRGALDALATKVKHGDNIVAVIDSADTVNPEEDTTNNSAVSSDLVVDVVAASVSVAVTETQTNAVVSYTIIAPATIAAFDIQLGIDVDDGNTIDTNLGAAFAATALTPGAQVTSAQNIRGALDGLATKVNNSDNIVANVDSGDTIAELSNANNTAVSPDLVVDLVAASATVAVNGSSTTATIAYTIIAPATVEPFAIEIGIDTDNNGTINTSLVTVSGSFPLTPGTHSSMNEPIRGPLDLLSVKVKNGDNIVAVVDPANTVNPEQSTTNNSTSSSDLRVDLVPGSLVLNAANSATFSYTVESPANVADYSVQFYSDANDTGMLEIGSDTLINTQAGSVTPEGPITDPEGVDILVQAFAGVGIDQEVFAVLDSVPVTGTVGEANDTTALNTATTSGAAVDDLIASSIALSVDPLGDTTTAAVSYSVSFATDRMPYTIRVGVDRNGDDIIDTDADVLATVSGVTTANSTPTTAIPDFRALLDGVNPRIKHGDSIVATLDLNRDGTAAGAVSEAKEVENNAVAQTQTVDIAAGAVIITAPTPDQTSAIVSYSINAPGRVEDFFITVGLDRAPFDGQIDAGSTLANMLVTGAETTPGGQSITIANLRPFLNGLSAKIKHADRIIAVLDSGNSVIELDDGQPANNNVATQDQVVDPPAITVTTIVGSFKASLAYFVDAPGNVAPFVIRFGIDNVNDGVAAINIPLTGGTGQPADLAGDVTPGAHSAPPSDGVDLSAALRAAGVSAADNVVIVGQIDPGSPGAVDESDDAVNNAVGGSGQFRVDLAARSINFIGVSPDTDFDPVVSYDVNFNQPGENFAIAVYASAFGDNAILTDDVLLRSVTISSDADKSEGTHMVTLDNVRVDSSDFASANFFIKVQIDDGAAVMEDNEDNNILVRANLSNDLTDTDGDGLTDQEELVGFKVSRYRGNSGRYTLGTKPDNGFLAIVIVNVQPRIDDPDSDDDGITDWDEVNTFARFADADGSVPSIGLGPNPNRIGRSVSKPVFGVRTDPTMADTDLFIDPNNAAVTVSDGLLDSVDPAPQINPPQFGFPADDSNVIKFVTALGQAGFQRSLLDFDQDGDEDDVIELSDLDGDGFLESPDANGDGIPDFTRYNEAVLERVFDIDFSNDGTIDDGYDVGGLNRGALRQVTISVPPDCVDVVIDVFGTYRVADNGDGVLDLADSTGLLMPTDNCPPTMNADQADLDGDGLGDGCDLDLDNDGVANGNDAVAFVPDACAPPPVMTGPCGFGYQASFVCCLLGLVGFKRAWRKRRSPARPRT